MNLHDLFAIPRARTPAKVALHYRNGGHQQSITYTELHQAVDGLAACLQRWGLRKGDRVAFFLGNRPEFVIAYLAVIRLGAIMVPVNLRYRKLELSHILSDATPRLIVTEREYLPLLEEIGQNEKASVEALLLAEELAQWQETGGQGDQGTRRQGDDLDGIIVDPKSKIQNPKWPLVYADDLAMIMYTSGTTGRSKGAMITHNNVIATVTGLLAAWAWEPSDRLYLCLPLFHTHGLIVGLHCALVAGATVLLRPAFELTDALTALTSGQASLFFAVPTIYVRLVEELQNPQSKTQNLNFAQMRLFCSGSALWPPKP